MTTKPIKKILCIEDDCESAALIREELLDRGFKVVVAHDGEEGLAAIEREWPDLVLCDIRMPGISGFEVLQRLRGRATPLNGLRFVFITGWSDREVEIEGRRLGADDFVVKPIDFDALAAIITGYSRTQHVVRALAYDIRHQEE
jgi:DNA-binding response OmpR family regulator